MARRPSRKRHSSDIGEDINLTPVMNLFMVLIPFLLLTAVFASTAIIDVRLPQEAMAASEKKDVTPGDILTINVTRDGFSFSGLGAGTKSVKKINNRYDFDTLSNRLIAIKDKTPEAEEVIILFIPDTSYELVIKLMDTARDALTSVDGKKVRRTLFPVVSLGEYAGKGK